MNSRNLFRGAGIGLPMTLTLALLAGCTGAFGNDGPVLRILAGSELADMADVLEGVEERTGVELELEFTGTLDGTQLVAEGGAADRYDATWFPSNRYLSLLDGGTAAVADQENVMSSPVVLGVTAPVAAELGWDTTTPTWNDVVAAVDAGELTFGMTSPIASNSGFSALIEAATALSGTGTALTEPDVAAVTPALQRLFAGQELTAGSSGFLLDAFRSDPGAVDALFNYESVLRGVEVDGEPLVTVAPSDGIVTADYPLSLLSSASSAGDSSAKSSYDAVVADLLSPQVQEEIARTTNRRTSASSTTGPTAFELPFPNELSTVHALVAAYLGEVKPPSDMVLATDVSGSMEGDSLRELQAALNGLADTSTPERSFSAFQARETLSWSTFSDRVEGTSTYRFEESGRDEELAEFRAAVDTMTTGGGTAIYDALEDAYETAAEMALRAPDHHVSVTLFTDGKNNGASDLDDFRSWFEQNSRTVDDIPLFVVSFGDADEDELTELAELTGGKVFAGDDEAGLAGAFREIRGYQ